MQNGSRYQIVRIDGHKITDYFSGDMTVIEGLPDDIEVVQVWEEPMTQSYCFLLESEEFPVVPEGEEPPEVDLSVVQRRVNTTTHWVCPNCHDTHDNGDVVR